MNCSYDVKTFLLRNEKLKIIAENDLLIDAENKLSNHVQELDFWYLNGLKPTRRYLQDIKDIFHAFNLVPSNLDLFFSKNKCDTYGICMYSGMYITLNIHILYINYLYLGLGTLTKTQKDSILLNRFEKKLKDQYSIQYAENIDSENASNAICKVKFF